MVYKMKKELLDLVQDLNLWSKGQETGLLRAELKEVLILAEDTRMVLVIGGVRRAGKTFLAMQILKAKSPKPEQTLRINFEDPALEPYLNTNSLQQLYEAYRYFLNKNELAYIILDEVQVLPHWEKWVRIMLEKNEKVKFIITGSSSKMFKGELSAVLTGRTLIYTLLPLHFSDFLRFKGYQPKAYESYTALADHWNEYLQFGGFPLVVLGKEKNQYLKQLFDDILVKDIILKYKLRETEIKKLAVILINNFSALVSVQRLVKLMQEIAQTKISPTSVNKYLYYFEEAFLFFFIPIFSYKIKEQMLYPRKAYCVDTGLINAVSMRFSENIGRLYENLVALNLVRKYGKENIFYWKDPSGHEVDFIVKRGLSIKALIQVCFSLEKEEAKIRELRSLIKAMDEFKLEQGIIITEKFEGEESINGKKIVYIPLWKWLLEK